MTLKALIASPALIMMAALMLPISASHATTITYTANLSGPAESPPNTSPGTGLATVTTDDIANTLRRCDVQRLDHGHHSVTYPFTYPYSRYRNRRGCYYDTHICGFSLRGDLRSLHQYSRSDSQFLIQPGLHLGERWYYCSRRGGSAGGIGRGRSLSQHPYDEFS